MRLHNLAAAALIGSAGASFKYTEHDGLAALGMFNLGLDVALNGYPGEKCTLKNVAVRREWFVFNQL